MDLFFAPSNNEELFFDQEETQHLYKSKRYREGDTVHATDGHGWLYRAKITHIDRKGCRASIIEKEKQPKCPYDLTVVVSLLKNTHRFEWFIEKAVELEVSTVIPLITQRTEKPTLRMDRVDRIVRSACKQCLQTYKPTVTAPLRFDEFLLNTPVQGHNYIGYLSEEKLPRLEEHLRGRKEALVCIGPEGDFTLEEIHAARDKGFVGFSLGDARLRTETAAVAVCQIMKTMALF